MAKTRLRLLCAVLAMVTVPAVIQAQDYAYSVKNDTIAITRYMGSGVTVSVPNTLNGMPVTSIETAAFSLCDLTSLTIPDSVTNIGVDAFCGCYSLTAITVNASNPCYSSVGGVLFSKNQTTLVEYPGGKEGCYTIPNSVTNIRFGAFKGDTNLTSVTIPNGVTSIEELEFNGCIQLTNVVIGSSVVSIGNSTFYGCTGLKNITIPKSVTNLMSGAFYACTNLANVFFQGSAPGLGSSVFYGATKATIYYLPGTTGWGKDFGGRPTAVWKQ